MIWTRRDLLRTLPAALAGMKLARAQAPAAASAVSPDASVIRYAAPTDVDSALDQMRILREQLGAGVDGKLRLMVDGNGEYSVALLATGTDAEIDALARKQNDFFDGVGIQPRSRKPKDVQGAKAAVAAQRKYFQDAGVQRAQRVSSSGLRIVYNIRFGVPETLRKEAEKLFGALYRTLGDGAAKLLAVEGASDGTYSVVYRDMGDAESCEQTMAKYREVLEDLDIDTALAPEQNDTLVYSETEYLTETERADEVKAEPVLSAPGLQGALTSLLAARGVPGQRYAFHIVDVASGATLASLNAKVARECASMVKPYVALALFTQLKAQGPSGPLQYNDALRMLVERSLRESDNAATNQLFALLGGPASVQRILTTAYPWMLQNTHIVQNIPDGGRAYENRSSGEDYGRFMTALFKRRFPQSEELLRIMSLSRHSRLYWGATAVPDGTLQYNKTGSTNELIADEAILSARTVKGPRRAYFIVATVERDQPGSGHRKGRRADGGYHAFQKQAGLLIRALSSEAFRQLTPVYDFAPASPPPVSALQTHVAKKHLRSHGHGHRHHR